MRPIFGGRILHIDAASKDILPFLKPEEAEVR